MQVKKQKMRARPFVNQDFLRSLYTGKLIRQVLITLRFGQERELREGSGVPCFQETQVFSYT
jgi:hypothetical protein